MPRERIYHELFSSNPRSFNRRQGQTETSQELPANSTPSEQHIFNMRRNLALGENIVRVVIDSGNITNSAVEDVEAALQSGARYAVNGGGSTIMYRCLICRSIHSDISQYNRPYHLSNGVTCPECTSTIPRCGNCGNLHVQLYTTPFGELCQYCISNSMGHLKEYNYRPDPHFLHSRGQMDNNLYLGIELEVEMKTTFNPRSLNEKQLTVINIAQHDPACRLFYIKHDGSLNNGFEIVSHPATLVYHQEQFPWVTILNELVKTTIAERDSCGLHVHFSASFLGNNTFEREEGSLRTINIIDNSWTEIVKFACRKPKNIRQWAGSSFADLEALGRNNEAYDLLREFRQVIGSRYKAVNIMNFYNGTIELRMFQSTTNLEVIYAYLEFTDFIARLAREIPTTETESIDWNKLIKGYLPRDKYPNLWKFLRAKRLSCGVRK